MSTTEKPPRAAAPPLVEGQRLDQPEFHRRYEAMPPETRAELIDGVVYMPSPVSHAHDQRTPQPSSGSTATRRQLRALRSSVAPPQSLVARASPSPTRRCVFYPSVGARLGFSGGSFEGLRSWLWRSPKRRVTSTWAQSSTITSVAGVREYVVRALDPDEVIWHVRRKGRLIAVGRVRTGCTAPRSSRVCGSTLGHS